MNTRKPLQYTLNIKSPITNRAGLVLSASASWEVHRVKELILQFHPESPPVSAQQLIYKGKNIPNSCKLIDILSTDQEPTIILHIDMNFRVPEADYSAKIFHAREKEYINQYKRAMEFITSSSSQSSDSELFDSKSILNSLPLMHSDTMKRIYKMCVPTQTQTKVKLRPISLQNYLDVIILFRAGLFLMIIFFFLGLSGVINLSLVMVLFYIVNIRIMIQRHRDQELRRLPREYLDRILNLNAKPPMRRRNVGYLIWETVRSLGCSLAPWFDPVAYSEARAKLYIDETA